MDAVTERERVHGTCVAAGERGVLIRGPSGAGKSDLALRLIHLTLPATSPLAEYLPVQLVADDQVLLRRAAEHVIASVPEAIRGLMEVRGVGLVRVATTPEVNLALVVELVGADEVPRFPDPALCVTVCGIDVPCLRLQAAAASAPLKVLMALTKTARPG